MDENRDEEQIEDEEEIDDSEIMDEYEDEMIAEEDEDFTGADGLSDR